MDNSIMIGRLMSRHETQKFYIIKQLSIVMEQLILLYREKTLITTMEEKHLSLNSQQLFIISSHLCIFMSLLVVDVNITTFVVFA